MNVTSSGIINGVIQPQYGGHGAQFNENGIAGRVYRAESSLRSFPVITVG